MHVARWVLATLVTVSAVLAAVSVRVHRGEGGGFPPPSSGRLLPVDAALAGAPRVIGVLDGSHLDEITDVATASDTVFVLSRNAWRTVTGADVKGPFGAQPADAPDGIARGTRIIVADSGVYILDIGRREVSRWSRDGRLLDRLTVAVSQPIVPQDLAVSDDGGVFVVAQDVQRTGTRWQILRLAAGREPEVLRRAPEHASLFTQPRIAAAGDGILLFDPVTHATTALFSGTVRPRSDAPLWATPDSLRRSYQERLGRIRAAAGTSMTLPDTLPSLQAVAVTRSRIVLTGTNPVGDALHVEAFAPDGTPLGRLTDEPLSAPVFLTADGVVHVSEEPRSVLFTLLTIDRS